MNTTSKLWATARKGAKKNNVDSYARAARLAKWGIKIPACK